MKESFVYKMTNQYRTTFYPGVTADLTKRTLEHALGEGLKFTKKYNLADLIYFAKFSDIEKAIIREKQLKNWQHEWKLNLIKEKNPKLETMNY